MSKTMHQIFRTLDAALKDAPVGMEVNLNFQFKEETPNQNYAVEPEIIHHVNLENKKEDETSSELTRSLRRTYSEDFGLNKLDISSVSRNESSTEKTTTMTANTIDLFPPAKYIRLTDVERRKELFKKPESEYIDLTGSANTNVAELRNKLKDILPRVTKITRQTVFSEG